MIHPTAVISPRATLGQNTTIHPFAVIGEAVLGPGVVVHPHVVIADGVEIAAETEVFPGAFIGKEPKGAGAMARTPSFARHIRIGAGCSIGPHAVIFYDVEIGDGTLIGDGASIREGCRVGRNCIVSRYVTMNYDAVLGDRVKVMDGTHLTGGMTVGDDAFISVMVATMNDNAIGRAGFGAHVAGPAVASGAVIGGAAVLLPGVQIGEWATVAANATVTRAVEPGSRVMGSPARPAPERLVP